MGSGLNKVLGWRQTVEQELRGSKAPDIRSATLSMLALIAVESMGDPYAKHGSFRGLLQQYGPYIEDACDYLKRPHISADETLGNGWLSVLFTVAYLDRYYTRHEYRPQLMAVAHKGGAGYVREIKKRVDTGLTLSQAVDDYDSYRALKGLRKVPRVLEYVRRFDRYRKTIEGMF